MQAIEQLLADRAGLNVEVLGGHALDRAVSARMAACAISEPPAYIRLLHDSPRELGNLVDELTILETWFFRDCGPFEFLQEYAKQRQGLRVLSAGCSTGEEPYSIAMALLDAGLPAARFQIDACDLSPRALQAASRAIYGPGSFREDWHDFRNRWFEPAASAFALRPEIARLVHFHQEDLLHPVFLAAHPHTHLPKPGRGRAPYDVVFCRNVLIYLRREAQDSVLDLLGQLLRQGGIVVSGHAEVGILLRRGYEPVGQPAHFACGKSVPEVAAAPPPATRPSQIPEATREAVSTPVRSKVFAKHQEVQPESERQQLLQRARQLADQGAFDDAWLLCERLLAHGSDAEAYYLQGAICAARDRLDQAKELFRRALCLEPAQYESLVQMSLLCERQGETAQATLFRDRAARLAQHQPEAFDAQRR